MKASYAPWTLLAREETEQEPKSAFRISISTQIRTNLNQFFYSREVYFTAKSFWEPFMGKLSQKQYPMVFGFFSGGELCFKTFLCISEARHTCLLSISYNCKGAKTLPRSKTHSTARCSIKRWPPTHCHVPRGCH